MKIVVKIPMFLAKVVVLLGPYKKIAKDIPKGIDFINDDDTDYRGICGYRFFPGKKNVFVCVIHCRQLDYASIAHECLHAVNYILAGIGHEASFSNDEVQAYLLMYLISEIEKKVPALRS